jgi:hypothetical protein
MTNFVPDIEDDYEPEPFRDWQQCDIVEFSLGYYPDENTAVIMSVMLVPGASYIKVPNVRVYDLKFGIRTRDMEHEWKVGEPDFSHESVERYIAREDRIRVMECVLRAIEALISFTGPEHVTMVTAEKGLPEKALLKYVKICKVLNRLNFATLEQYQGESGSHYWYFKKAD